jgi:Fe-S-cluster-containing hydrogenase component 2
VCHGIEGLNLGISSALHKGHEKALTDPQKCNGCGLCISICPFGARYEKDSLVVADIQACFGCGLCRHKCPQGAISMKEEFHDYPHQDMDI